MSWFAGCYQYRGIAASRELAVSCKYDNYYKMNNLHLLSDETNTFIEQSKDQLKILCGNVLKKSQGYWKLVEEAWIPEPERPDLAGHYVGMRYSGRELEFYNDQFGLRELYYFQNEDGTIYFSTRMDILLSWREENAIDWEEFGSYWLNRNPIGTGYYIKGIKRLNQSGKLIFKSNQEEKHNQYWTAGRADKYKPEKVNDVIAEIGTFLTAPQNCGYGTVFALSGGYDSRALLALLLNSKIDFEAVTWGKSKHPDVQIAADIAAITGIKHNNIFTDLLESNNSWQVFADYCFRNQLVAMGTAVFELHHYQYLAKDKVLLDGGMGELSRRCLNANLEYRGSQAILSGDTDKILSFMSKRSADVFRDSLLQLMKAGLKERAEQAISEMPAAAEIGIGNWIDTWDVRQRLSNISSRSQQTLDDILRNFMPFVQRQVIEKAMFIPSHIRARNHIIDMMIRHNAKDLRRIPTIRNGLKMPYGTGRIAGKIRAILGNRWSYKENTNQKFLNIHRERIKDIASDCQLHQRDIYDPGKIAALVNNYYQTGELELEMIWWLSFEVFRQKFKLNI